MDNFKPWPALWSLVIGFFMILVDSTIVNVATPAIMADLDADIDKVIWVISAYLLAYAVPLLVTGRLGDRFGPRRIYLLGLVVFTGSSAWCGFADSVDMLILARVVQGLGAALMTPQTMSVITRIFPPQNRGTALGLWGATAGVATLVGPVLGGILVDTMGWEWIFFINVPVGVVGFILAFRLVPKLPTAVHRFDLLGVFLSAAGMFCLVFGIQEGESYNWGTITGPLSVWSLIIAGLVLLALFVLWQRLNRSEPLLPLSLFRDRNFSLANVSITAMGFAITAFSLPLILYAQTVRGLSPTQAALLLTPMAVLSGVLAPLAGKLAQRSNPKYMAISGFAALSVSLFWLGSILTPDTPYWLLMLPVALMGLANSCIWSPVSLTATRNLAPAVAGAGSGVYNTTRQFGAVIGSSAIGAMMQSRLSAQLGGGVNGGEPPGGVLPEPLAAGYAAAMGQSLYLPGAVILIGMAAALFYARPHYSQPHDTALPTVRTPGPPAETGAGPATGTGTETGTGAEDAARSR